MSEPKKCTDPSFKYTPVAEQGPDYLRKKFEAMKKAKKQREKETVKRFEDYAKRKA